MSIRSFRRLFPANLTTKMSSGARPAMLLALRLGIPLAPMSIASCCLLSLAAPAANAQWSVTVFTPPPGSGNSALTAVHGGQQVGYAGGGRAAIWSGSAGSFQNVTPANASGARLLSTDGLQQGGWVDVAGVRRAGIWSGTSASFVDLHPGGSLQSQVNAVRDGWQVGSTQVNVPGFGPISTASLWNGTSGSWVDLGGVGEAFGVHNGFQVGYISGTSVFSNNQATLWNGTAASRVNLSPGGGESIAYGVFGTQQVGFAFGDRFNPFTGSRAALWNGTAASHVDLNPAGATHSMAFGTSGTWQVGFADVGGLRRASVWNGTAASWFDLSQLLDPSLRGFTVATGIWTDSTTTYISGFTGNPNTGTEIGVMWTFTVPTPASSALVGLGGLLAARRRR